MTSWSECSVSVFLSLIVGIMAAAPTMLPVWQCDTGNGKWYDYPVDITKKLEAVHNNRNAPADQLVEYEYDWKGDKDRPPVEFSYHIYAKGCPFPLQINHNTKQMRHVRRVLIPEGDKEAASAIQIDQGQKRSRTP